MLEQDTMVFLKKKATHIRKLILRMIFNAQSGHAGGSLSAVEILVALYYHVMKHNPALPAWPDRDRFILSKGHGAPALYAVLADCGYFPEEDLDSLRRLGSHLQGHPNPKTPGVEATAGSLGQGLSLACGMALGARIRGDPQHYYVLCGDGELQEGQIWEAALFAAGRRLDNVVVFIDRNGYQQNGPTEYIQPLGPLPAKWNAFGWDVQEVDGHDFASIVKAAEHAKSVVGKPTVIIAQTIKGKGVSFMENQPGWHGKSVNAGEWEAAIKELNGGV